MKNGKNLEKYPRKRTACYNEALGERRTFRRKTPRGNPKRLPVPHGESRTSAACRRPHAHPCLSQGESDAIFSPFVDSLSYRRSYGPFDASGSGNAICFECYEGWKHCQ